MEKSPRIILPSKSTDNSGGASNRWTLAGNNKLTLLASVPLGGGPWSLRALGDLLATQVDGQVVLFDKSGATSLQQIGVSDSASCFYGLNLDGADGDLTRGLGFHGARPAYCQLARITDRARMT